MPYLPAGWHHAVEGDNTWLRVIAVCDALHTKAGGSLKLRYGGIANQLLLNFGIRCGDPSKAIKPHIVRLRAPCPMPFAAGC